MTRQGNAARADIGIIGGSGLYDIEGLRKVKERCGQNSVRGSLRQGGARRVGWDSYRLSLAAWTRTSGQSFGDQLSREYLCPEVARVFRRVISVSAVGSMKESIKPGDVVLPDQFIDLTKRRVSTFFEGGHRRACGVWRSGLRLARGSIVGCGP